MKNVATKELYCLFYAGCAQQGFALNLESKTFILYQTRFWANLVDNKSIL